MENSKTFEQNPISDSKTPLKPFEGWTWKTCFDNYYLESDLLKKAGFKHGFFSRSPKHAIPEELTNHLCVGATAHLTTQVHGNKVIEASRANSAPWPFADALVSNRFSQCLWVATADCNPVLIADRMTGHVATCHVGWKGLKAKVLLKTLKKLETSGAKKEQLYVAMGPAISGQNYQVDIELAKSIANLLREDDHLGHENWNETLDKLINQRVFFADKVPNKIRIDIRQIAAKQLKQFGLKVKQISICPACTMDEKKLFNSWRRDKDKSRQWSGIVSSNIQED